MNALERLLGNHIDKLVKPCCYPIYNGSFFVGNGVVIVDKKTGQSYKATVRHVLEQFKAGQDNDEIVLDPFIDTFENLPIATMWNLTQPVYLLGFNSDLSFDCIPGDIILSEKTIGQNESVQLAQSVHMIDILFDRNVCKIIPTTDSNGSPLGGKSGSVVVNGRAEAVAIVAEGNPIFAPRHARAFSLIERFDGVIKPYHVNISSLHTVPEGLATKDSVYYSFRQLHI